MEWKPQIIQQTFDRNRTPKYLPWIVNMNPKLCVDPPSYEKWGVHPLGQNITFHLNNFKNPV